MLFCTVTEMDLQILYWIRENLASPFLDAVMPVITLFGDGGIFWIAVSLFLMFTKKYRRAGFSMGLALLIGVALGNGVLKNVIARVRPYDFDTALVPLVSRLPSDFSFPSGHTLASFEAAIALTFRSKKLGIPALVLAALIAFSRLYLLVHYPTDIIAALLLAYAFALLASFLVDLLWEKYDARKKRAEEIANKIM